MKTEDRPAIVLGVIGSDCHAVGNRILADFFTARGFRVVNLGVMTSQEEFIAAAVETGAGAILVSSLYGHGEIDCRGLREKCRETGLGDIILYAGGNLVVGDQAFADVEKRFRDMGFNRVFPATVDLDSVPRLLKADLKRAGKKPLPARRAGPGRKARPNPLCPTGQ